MREAFLNPSYQSTSCDIQTPTSNEVYRSSPAIRCGSRSASFLCLHSTPLIWVVAIYLISHFFNCPESPDMGFTFTLRQVRSNRENPAEFGAGVHPGLQQSWILHRSRLILIDHQCVISYCDYHFNGCLEHLTRGAPALSRRPEHPGTCQRYPRHAKPKSQKSLPQ